MELSNDTEFQKFVQEYNPIQRKEIEFRLYYNDDGSIICYSCDNLGSKFIVIDAQTYAECRQNVKVVDGKIEVVKPLIMLEKLVESTHGTRCAIEDINIVVSSGYIGDTILWEMKKYEFECN
jgi:hypothetical protein